MYHELDAGIGSETRHVTTFITSFNMFEFRCATPSSFSPLGFPWRVGSILGPSGSGKSTNLKLFEGMAFDGFVLFCVYLLLFFNRFGEAVKIVTSDLFVLHFHLFWQDFSFHLRKNSPIDGTSVLVLYPISVTS